MKKTSKHSIIYLFIGISIVSLSLVVIIILQYFDIKKNINKETPLSLEKAIEKTIKEKMEGIYYVSHYTYDPQEKKIGEYETKSTTHGDTTFTYQYKIVDAQEKFLRNGETLLLEIEKLHPRDIQLPFDNLLKEKNIYAKSAIGIVATFCKPYNEWSNDTTQIHTNFRISLSERGIYEAISYYAFLDLSFLTYWNLMQKTVIFFLLFIDLVTVVFLVGLILKRRKIKKVSIQVLKDGDYQIIDIIYKVDSRKLIVEDEIISLSPQLGDLLLMFLQAENHRVSKEHVKTKFWEKNVNPVGNMTTSINNLKKKLEEAKSNYSIVTDPMDDKYYVFLYLTPKSIDNQILLNRNKWGTFSKFI